LRCKRFDKLIYLFLDGRLNQSEKRELEEHLSQCKRCQERLSLLEAVEGRASKIEIKEPPQEYWESFSSRVREKILVRKERSPAVRFKKAMESILTFSPSKIKIAAGLVAAVLVFIIGKLYMDYRGGEMAPPAPVIRTVEVLSFDTVGIEKRGTFPTEERDKEIHFEKPGKGMKPTITDETKEKTVPPERADDKREALLKEKELPTHPKVVKEKDITSSVPALEDHILLETPRPSEEQFISPETKSIGAGVEEGVKDRMMGEITLPKDKARKAEGIHKRGGAEEPASKVFVAAESASRLPPAMDYYVVNKKPVPKIEANDTLMQVGELRRLIQVWKTHIEENPSDSLTNQGYLQVAVGYYLLGRLTQDTTDISAGARLIEGYLDEIKDPTIKTQLNDQLEKIKASGER